MRNTVSSGARTRVQKSEASFVLINHAGMPGKKNRKEYIYTVFTRLSAAALFKFSELRMRRSFGGGAQSGAALFKTSFICEL